MTLADFLFYVLAIMTAISAVAVVLTQNIVRAATWLLFALAGTAGIFFLLGADFIGATQLLIYVGGTLVLVVFGVMLTAQGPFISMKIGAAEWAISLGVGLLLYGVLAVALAGVKAQPTTLLTDLGQSGEQLPEKEKQPGTRSLLGSKYLGAALLGDRRVTPDARLTGVAGFPRERAKMNYLLPFEIVSVHLLVVLIGAAYLARAKRRRGAPTV
jgi:NADH-quinone oxidoreductase subunit J